MKTRKFRVLERARLVDGIGAEKALSQQGMSTGEVGRSQYIGAVYLFEATISEASAGDRASSFTLGVAGAVASRGTASDSIAIDALAPDDKYTSARKDSVDQTLREAIEEAVAELARRLAAP